MGQPAQATAEVFANWATGLGPGDIPQPVRTALESLVIDASLT